MIPTEKLKIFKHVYIVNSLMDDYYINFPKLRKVIPGQTILKYANRLLELVFVIQFNKQKDKRKYLIQMLYVLETFRMKLRQCCEKKLISIKQCNRINQLLRVIRSELIKWIKLSTQLSK